MGGMYDDEGGDLALLPELLDRSFGAGPEGLPTPADRLAEGRRVRRRRRRLAVAGRRSRWSLRPASARRVSGLDGNHAADGPPPPLATSGTARGLPPGSGAQQKAPDRLAKKAREQAHRVEQRLVDHLFPVAFGPDGEIVVKDGWRITKQIEEPMGYRPPEASLGVAVTDGHQTRWLLVMHEYGEDGEGHVNPDIFSDPRSADDAGKGYSRFEDWLASMVDLQGGAQIQPLVVVGGDDRVQPGTGAEVVAVQPLPVVDGYSSAGDRMAEVHRDGRTWFVVIRGHGPDAEVIPVDAEVLSAPTFDALVDHVRAQAGSGEGLR